jgi:hypothetical protein
MKLSRINRYRAFLATFSIITIPIYTLLFATKESPFQYTLSQIGNFFGWDHRKDFIIWGLITGGGYMYYLGFLFNQTYFQNKKGRVWLFLSNMFLVLTVFTPSMKELLPFFTGLHILFSTLFAVSLVLSTAFFIEYLGRINAEITARSTTWGIIVIGGSVISLFVFGKTGIFELFFLITFSISLIALGLWLRNDEKIKAFVHDMRRKAENSIDTIKHKLKE